jgi:hypothetical protein
MGELSRLTYVLSGIQVIDPFKLLITFNHVAWKPV